ncbi:proline--tRNA ligase [Desulfoprunum benzoelyticum]|uniref:Proline--tRNA ligase n=1 Tax=Desulfoprunum benzoelyticum TaxID=1506996 RepID=A0A840UU97_9BACT|nr:proline--tRNA ligase [Desulfoprunum benzoelyticum]MBB5348353.1 prolyl-tRNA synthetase [Desulfoprunum benzoelyticum]MBM9528787.1 proline--tRNA ligase [Desulfoprunum benzoelyticum]
MRYSQLFLPTLKETPAEAEVVSHRLMLRAGFIRKLSAGVYTYLPYGLAALRRVEQIVREEMNRAGAQELLMPMVQPADLWKETGRYDKYGPELLRFVDRHERESCLGPTHEEVITDIVRRELHSYRDLPVNFYQIQSKFRDEIRPRFGLMRGREFVMKDAYSFDVSDEQAEASYMKMFEAYRRIFTRCGLNFRAVQADSGAIGGNFSHEFMVLAKTGEDTIVVCTACEYAANMEKAEVRMPATIEVEPMLDTEKVETPGKRKVESVCESLGIPPSRLIKTMIYLADGLPVAVLVRGDREVEEVKLKNLLQVADVELADDKQAFDATGVPTGYIGPVGLGLRVVADQEVALMRNAVTGANQKNYHLKNVNPGRDFQAEAFTDLRQITTDDPCPVCGGCLELTEGIEVGHIFKLGTSYSEKMQAMFQDSDGSEKPFVMGCYGIGVSRVVAAAIEQNHDDNGIIFPVPLAPFKAIILDLDPRDERIDGAAQDLYRGLTAKGIEVLLDDRDERPGAKFKDADLLGIPYRITVGKKYLQDGFVELRERKGGEVEELSPEQLLTVLPPRIAEAINR